MSTTDPSSIRKPTPPVAVDRIEILSVMDNYVDVLLGGGGCVTRPPLSKTDTLPTDTLVAEHGLSMMITVYSGEEKRTVLLDTGYNSFGVLHNLALLGRSLDEIEAIVISHGHMDHTGSLYEILDRIGRPVDLVVHPHAFEPSRYLQRDGGQRLAFPQTLDRSRIGRTGARLREISGIGHLANGAILVTGEVKRTTSFEQGMPNAMLERDGVPAKDPINDDQALVMHLRNKGLVVVSGCAHSGIANTIRYCRELTGIDRVHAVLGGFHLTGPLFEPIIGSTIEELKAVAPDVIVPMHCTGWTAMKRISQEFPGSFLLNSVGSLYSFR